VRTLDELYAAALGEGGNLFVYAGGDYTGQYARTKEAFMSRFPGMNLQLIVDYSKFHDARIDYQISTNTVVFDVAHLQTIQNYPRWKGLGALLNYKPIGFERVHEEFKDPDGSYYGIQINCFGNTINSALLPDNSTWPTEARDYLRPEFKGKLIATYPNDDDAILFLFKQIVDKYGVQYLHDFKNQEPVFARGSHVGGREVTAGRYPATFTSGGSLRNATGSTHFVLPKEDPFVMWPQIGAIFKNAPHPEAAKLYMSWALDKTVQEGHQSFSVRDDVPSPAGYEDVFGYNNGDPLAFGRFMADRRAAETFRSQIGIVFGEVVGENTAGSSRFGLHPVMEPPVN